MPLRETQFLSDSEKRFCNVMFCMRFCSLAWHPWHIQSSTWTFAQRLRCLYSAAWLVSKNSFDDYVMAGFWASCGHCSQQALFNGSSREYLQAMSTFVRPSASEWTLHLYQNHVWCSAWAGAQRAGAQDHCVISICIRVGDTKVPMPSPSISVD